MFTTQAMKHEIFLTPSEAFCTMIFLGTYVEAYSFFQPTIKEIQIQTNSQPEPLNLEIPPLVWKLTVNHDGTPSFNTFGLFAWKKFKEEILLLPWDVFNVDQYGRVCFGKNKPRNLREAHNIFWNSSFSLDYWRGWEFHKRGDCGTKQHTCHNFVKT